MTKFDLDLLMLISRAILNAHYVFLGINDWTWGDGDGGPNEEINSVVFYYALEASQRLGRELSPPNFLNQEFYSPLIGDFTLGSKVGYEEYLSDKAIDLVESPEYIGKQEESLFDGSLPFIDDADYEEFYTSLDVNNPCDVRVPF